MNRPILDEPAVHPAIRDQIAGYQRPLVDRVRAAVAAHRIVIVGMAQNPFPRKARRLLDARAVAYHYLEYGSYFSQWRERLALKMWTGWPTLPMVFIDGVLIGGASDLQKLIDSGEFDRLVSLKPRTCLNDG